MPFFASRAALYVLMVMTTFVVLLGHQSVPPMDRDESRFAQASRQMQQTGDYVTVRFQDEYRAKKPAGIYWLQSAFASLFDKDHIASYRFVNLLALLTAIFMIYHMASALYDARAALAAGALLASGFLVLGEAHLAKTDTVLMTLAIVQQWALMRVYLDRFAPSHGGSNRWLWFWLAMTAGILIKGPVLPALALVTVLVLSLWHRDLKWLAGLRAGYGILVVLVLCLPWAILVSVATDGAFLAGAIKGDFLAKVHSGQESHGAPPGVYALLAGVLIWPATPLLVSFFAGLRAFVKQPETLFLLAWLVPFWLVLELIPTKLPHYILPLLPALILLLVGAVIPPSPHDSFVLWRGYLAVALRYLGVSVGLVFAVIAIWGAMQFGGATSRSAMSFALVTTALCLLAVWCGHLWVSKRLWSPFFAMVGAALLMQLSFFSGVVPALSRLHVSPTIAAAVAGLGKRPTAMAAAGYHEPSLVFHLGRDLLLVDGREAALFLAEAPGGLAIVEMRQEADFIATSRTLGLRLQPPIRLTGFNISKGEDVVILLYRTEMFDAKADTE